MKTTRAPLGNPLYRIFLDAAEQAGYARTKDINGYQQDGFGVDDMTISKSKRCSAAHAYLHPIRSRENLEVVTDALVGKIIIEGNRAAGVSYTRDGVSASATAAREVILSAGAINTPQVLMLSGIGPPELLKEHGIAVMNPLPGVGENLMDHVAVTVQHECLQPVSRQASVRPLGRLRAGVQWLLFKSGDAATNQFEASGYVRSGAGIRQPVLQIDFIPFALTLTKSVEPVAHGFQTHATIMRSPGRGWVRLASADLVSPRGSSATISPRRRTLFSFAPASGSFARFTPNPPSTYIGDRKDARALSVQRMRSSTTTSAIPPTPYFTYAVLAGMGPDAHAVTDEQGRVHGLEGLRVVDASLMPRITTGNTNAPTIMIAEKIADAIRGLPALPATDVESYEMPDWQTRQRPGEPQSVGS